MSWHYSQFGSDLAQNKKVRETSVALASTAAKAGTTLLTGSSLAGTAAGMAVTAGKAAAPHVFEEIAAGVGGVVTATAIGFTAPVWMPLLLVYAWLKDD